MNPSAGTMLLLAAGALASACERAPDEPALVRRAVPGPAAAPTVEEAARRLAADGAVVAPHRLAAPAPQGTVFMGFTREGRAGAALVDGQRAWFGLAGAERALALWRAAGTPPDAARLARVVAASAYPGYLGLFAGERYELPDGGALRGPAPALVPYPAGGRVLTFSFVIPPGEVGAGLHVARWRWTDTDLLIDEAPHPERR